MALMFFLPASLSTAEQQAPDALVPSAEPSVVSATTDPVNPWERRPECASMFMKADWRLTKRQRVCDWIHNRMFATNALVGAAWSAGFSQMRDATSERGDNFATRFSRRFAQNAVKSTGGYLGGLVFREDPRTQPPFLVMRDKPRPRGFWRRTAYAIGTTVIAYRCEQPCTKEEDIQRVFALSRVTGALASGFAGQIWTWDEPDARRRALRGAASAYGSTFVNRVITEFKPELSAFAGKTITKIFGVR